MHPELEEENKREKREFMEKEMREKGIRNKKIFFQSPELKAKVEIISIIYF